MVKLRLRRMGRRKRPLYALVAADSRSPRDGRYIEDLGRYDSLQEPATVSLKEDRVLYWLQQGAQPSDTVRSLLSREGLMLALHMTRKGADQEAIDKAVQEHRERVAEKWEGRTKTTAKDRRDAMLAAEAEKAAKEAAELAKIRAEAEKKAREAAEAAQKEQAEQRAKAAEEAKKAQEAANEASADGDAEAGDANEPASAAVEAAPALDEAAAEAAEAQADAEEAVAEAAADAEDAAPAEEAEEEKA